MGIIPTYDIWSMLGNVDAEWLQHTILTCHQDALVWPGMAADAKRKTLTRQEMTAAVIATMVMMFALDEWLIN